MNNNIQEEEIHINELIRPYLKRWKWFVLGGIFALFISYLFLKTQNPVYEVVSTVLIKDSKKSIGGQDFEMLRDLSGLGKMSSDGVDNEIEVLKSKKLMTTVIKDLGLETDIYVPGFFKDTEVYGKTSPIIIKIISEKETSKPFAPIRLTLNGDKLVLSSENIGTVYSRFNKLISLENANIIILKNKNFVPNTKNPTNELILNISSLESKTNNYQSILNATLANKDVTVIKFP